MSWRGGPTEAATRPTIRSMMPRLLFGLLVVVAGACSRGTEEADERAATDADESVIITRDGAPTATGPPTSTSAETAASPTPDADRGSDEVLAAFFYPWYPEAWRQSGYEQYTNFTPLLGSYVSLDWAVIDQQLEWAEVAGIDAFITSWWGPGHRTDPALGVLLDRTVAEGSPNPDLEWAVYYEFEGQADPTPEKIAADLDTLAASFAHPNYLLAEGRPVVFVYAQPEDGVGMTERWAQAMALTSTDPHVVLKVYPGYRDAPDQPGSWHQYAPAVSYDDQSPHSIAVSPGFWKPDETARLGRKLERFREDLQRMAESEARWKLITTWNEWGEGSSVEPAVEFSDDYLTAIAETIGHVERREGASSAPPPDNAPARTSVQPVVAADGSVRFAAAGDFGASEETTATLTNMAADPGSFLLALGDLGYSDLEAPAWCRYISELLGDTPVQLVVGNHEDDDRVDGYIDDFAACLPDRMDSTGTYGVDYHFDLGTTARIIMLPTGNQVGGVRYDYEPGSAQLAGLVEVIRDARTQGISWVIVGVHKVCISAGKKSCELTPGFYNTLIDEGVDLVLHGHDHNYQRSHQLSCVVENRYDPGCVADDGLDGQHDAGAGMVAVIVGSGGGGSAYAVDRDDPEIGYFASHMGIAGAPPGRGHAMVTADPTSLVVEFVGSTTRYSDRVEITRS